MKVLLLNTYDITGGAARAVYRIHRGLQQIGIDCRMMVLDKRSHDGSVISIGSDFKQKLLGRHHLLDLLPLAFYPKRQWRSSWSIGWKWNSLCRKIEGENPDLIHLNWVGRGFVPIRALSLFRVPMVWTLTDMWPLTGGCHFPQACEGYLQSCGSCPQLSSNRENDLSRWIWRQKRKYWKDLNLTLVAPSRWIRNCAETSSLFRRRSVRQIPFGLNPDVFKPAERSHSRRAWGFPEDSKIILAGGVKFLSDPRKGFRFLRAATKVLGASGWAKRAEIVIFGASRPSHPPEMGLRTAFVGHIEDDVRLRSLYAASDVFVAPSTQESFCQTVLEALSCGTPCVGFEVGALPDMITTEENGYLARPFDIHDLATGVKWALTNGVHGKESVLEWKKKEGTDYSYTEIAHRYARLYAGILKRQAVSHPAIP